MNTIKRTLLASLLAVALAGCGSAEDSASGFVESGNNFLEAGNIERARVQYRNALQIDPRLAEPYYRLALIDEKSQNWRGMYANLTTAEALNPDYPEVIVKLGQMYLLSDDLEEAMKRADRVLEQNPDNVEAITLKASVYLKQENFGSATREIDRALALAPGDMNVQMLQVNLFKLRGDRENALSILDVMIADNPDAMPLFVQKLTILEEMRRYEAMLGVYNQMAELHPDERWIAESKARLLNTTLNRHDDARAELADFVARNPQDTQAKLLHVGLIRTVDAQAGLDMLGQYIEAEPGNTELRFARVEGMLADGKTQEVINDLQTLIEREGTSEMGLRARSSLANIRAQQGDFAAAMTLIDEVLAASSGDEAALITRAKLHLQAQRIDDAVTDLRLAIRNNPDSDEALVLLAQSYLLSGSQQLADETFRRALTANPRNQTAALAVSATLAQSADYERAEQILLTAMQNNVNPLELLQALAQLRLLREDWDGAERAFDQLKASGAESLQLHVLMGQMYEGIQNYESAITEYQSALKINPSAVIAIQGVVNSYLAMGQRTELTTFLDSFLRENPDQIGAYGVKANLQRDDQEFEQAKQTVKTGLQRRSDWVPGYSLLALLEMDTGDRAAAIKVYQQGLEAVPGDTTLTMQLASAYYAESEYDKARDLYEQVLQVNPQVEAVINNLAVMLLDQYNSPENIQRAVEMTERFRDANHPYLLDTYAWANINAGNYELAYPALNRAISLDSSVGVFYFHMAVLQHRMEDLSKAQEALARAEQMAREANDQRLMQRIDKFKQETGI
ncbi:tetratricopeptide repeat protein [Methylophaga lonarensis]|uniref:tetratricopeptide repeat protein n=1 Tax=Methylophaga lonarensis TaxID=999151 RepID=UPI003D278E3E